MTLGNAAWLRLAIVLVFCGFAQGTPAQGQALLAAATIDAKRSGFTQSAGAAMLELSLSQKVPFRVFTLSGPDRLVLDFQDIDWRGLPKSQILGAEIVADLRYGVFQPGWSRLVLDLNEPMRVETAELDTSLTRPALRVALRATDRASFEAASGAAEAANWLRSDPRPGLGPKSGLRIAIDPGHGGVDPGAVREGVMEKDIALSFSLELARTVEAETGFDVVLTREDDISVSLSDRVRIAREADADLFLSVHSNTVTRGDASGAAVYTLSERASDADSAKLAELENRADLSVGLTHHVEGDDVARILVDLSRVDTNARSKIFADGLIASLGQSVDLLRTKPHRSAGFRVLKAHDIPSVLLELGFMSNARDRRNMLDATWRAQAAAAVARAVRIWARDDLERSKLVLK